MAKQQNYKQKLLYVSEIKATGLTQLHQRVRLLVEVFEDQVFRADIGGDDYALATALDAYVDDCALTFLELRSVMQAYPEATQWERAKLRSLYTDATAKERPAKDDEEKPARRTATVKELDELSLKLKDAEFVGKTLTEEVSELRQENRRLLAENARMEGRISELERMIERFSPRRETATAR